MDEDVLTAVTFDEPVAFIVVEPFHSAYFGHCFLRPAARGLAWASLFGAMFGPLLPDQGPIDADPLEAQGLVERDGRAVEVVDEQRDAAPLAGQVTADLAQQRTAEAAPPASRVGPHTHQLHGFQRDRPELALRHDRLR